MEDSPSSSEAPFSLVRLPNGTHSVRTRAYAETMHPAVGPAAEADALYVNQLQLKSRLAAHAGEFVIWDIGLGAGANILAALRSAPFRSGRLRLLSFDLDLAPLQFAWENRAQLGYFTGFEDAVASLLTDGQVTFEHAGQTVEWTFHAGNFPILLHAAVRSSARWPAPSAILFDAFSPAKNPEMWTAALFADLYAGLSADVPCNLATYSRSTHFRVALLLAGFYVGSGQGTGQKEETTLAANDSKLLAQPLPAAWLERIRRSSSAEPLWEPVYRQAPLGEETLARLRQHPQFRPS